MRLILDFELFSSKEGTYLILLSVSIDIANGLIHLTITCCIGSSVDDAFCKWTPDFSVVLHIAHASSYGPCRSIHICYFITNSVEFGSTFISGIPGASICSACTEVGLTCFRVRARRHLLLEEARRHTESSRLTLKREFIAITATSVIIS